MTSLPGIKYLCNFWKRLDRQLESIAMVKVDAVCLFVWVCRAWPSPWRSVSSWGPTASCRHASSARTCRWCGCTRTTPWGRMTWTGEGRHSDADRKPNSSVRHRLRLSWGEFPAGSPDGSPAAACARTESPYIWKPSEHEREISDHPTEGHIHLRTLHFSLSDSLSLLSLFCLPFIRLPAALGQDCFYNVLSGQMKTLGLPASLDSEDSSFSHDAITLLCDNISFLALWSMW